MVNVPFYGLLTNGLVVVNEWVKRPPSSHSVGRVPGGERSPEVHGPRLLERHVNEPTVLFAYIHTYMYCGT